MELIKKISSKLKENSKLISFIAAFYALTNIPAFVNTYTAPKEQIKDSLCEQIKYETSSLFDISGGAVYANFRLLGSSTGYIARQLFR